MKITKAPKRLAEANDAVKTLLLQISAATDDELPPILDGISEWCWPRGDLHYWTATLNRFDDILAETCADYDLSHLQINDFTPNRKRLLVSVLRFSRLLLENCTNRKLYNSFEHLNVLLATPDVDVLEATLRLILRPAQQYSSQGGGRRAEFAISPERLNALAVTWAPREHGVDMVEWARDDASFPAELSHVKFHFYRHRSHKNAPYHSDSHVAGRNSDAAEPFAAATPQRPGRTPSRQQPTASASAASGLSFVPAPVFPTTPTPAGRPRGQSPPAPSGSNQPSQEAPRDLQNEGLVAVDLGNLMHTARRLVDVLADAVEKYSIPSEDHFELLQKVRLAMGVKDAALRRQLLVCRLLAVAIYAHTTPESTASTQLFLYEPDIVQRLARVVDPSSRVGTVIQSGAFYALDALGRYRGKVNDVLTAVNASANHGILLHVLRDLVGILSTGDEAQPDDRLIDALFGFVSFVTSTVVGSNMVVSAGLLPLLIKLVEKTSTRAYMLQRTVTRAVGLIDSVLYAYQPSFGLFCAARGLDVFVARIESEVKEDVEDYAEGKPPQDKSTGADHPDNLYGRLSFGRAQLLRHLCKSISHMMSTTGTAEGLRNLIDSSLLSSIKRIFQHRRVFGGQILALSIHIMATFIHNEPTSLGIVQEKQIPQAFLDLVEEDIEANYDVIAAIPNAIGALCLNQSGIDLLNSRPLVPKLFALFTSTRYTKVLADRDNASLFGSSIDELVRHQPSVKQSVIECAVRCLKDIEVSGQKMEIGADEKKGYLLLPVPQEEQTDVEMRDATGGIQSSAQNQAAARENSSQQSGDEEIILDEPELFPLRPKTAALTRDGSGRENEVIGYIEVATRFLDGLFQTTGHCKDFLKQDGLSRLLALYRLPCLPYDFVNSVANDSLVTLIRFIVEISPHTVLNAVLEHVKSCLFEAHEAGLLQPISRDARTSSALLELAKPSDEESAKAANFKFRLLVNLNAATHLLADIAPTFGYSGSKLPTTLFTTLNSASSLLATKPVSIEQLGDLQRVAAWENVQLKAATASVTSADIATASSSSRSKASSDPTPSPRAEDTANDNAMVTGNSDQSSTTARLPTSILPKKSSSDCDPYHSNVVALRHLSSSLPSSIVSFFLETSRLLTERRSSDSNHRKQAHTASLAFAKVLVNCLSWQDSDRPVESLTFATTMAGFASSLLYDDRPHGSGVFAQTLTLSAFVKQDGLQVVLENYDRCNSEISKHFDASGQHLHADAAPDRASLGHACGSLRVSLVLLQRLVSSKAIEESPATAMMSARAGARPVVDDFDAANLVVRIRSEVLPKVQQTWQQPWLAQMPLSITRALISTLSPILEAQGEAAQKAEPNTSSLSASRAVSRDTNAASGSLGNLQRSMTSIESALAGLTGMLGGHGSGAPSAHRSRLAVQPGESQTRQLMEMGFPRAAARAALSRCANNLTLATDYLLTHPEIVANPGPDLDPAPEESQPSDTTNETDSAAAEASGANTSAVASSFDGQTPAQQPETSGDTASGAVAASDPDVQMTESGTDASPATGSSAEQQVSSLLQALNAVESPVEEGQAKDDKATSTQVDTAAIEAAKARKASLDAARASLHDGLMSRVLSLADRHGSLVFEAKSLFKLLAKDESQKQAALDAILEDLQKDRLDALRNDVGEDATERRLAVRLRLTAILLTDSAAAPLLGSATIAFVITAAAELVGRAKTTEATPPWRASLLLSASAALGRETQIRKTEVTTEQDPEKLAAVPQPQILDTRQSDTEVGYLYEYCLRCLAAPLSLSREELLAVYRLLTVLTRRPEMSQRLALDGHLGDVLKPFACVSPWTIAGCQVFTVLILRQVIESRDLLRALLEHEVRVAFDAARNRTMDTNTLARHLSSAMLRDPELFVELAAENMDMIDFVAAKSQGIVRLRHDTKPGPTKKAGAEGTPEVSGGERPSGQDLKSDGLQTVMDLLVSETLAMGPKVKDALASASNSASEQHGAADEAGAHAGPIEEAEVDGKPPSTVHVSSPASSKSDDSADKIYFYTCFLLQCLTEVLSSYAPAKRCLIQTAQRSKTQAADVATQGHPGLVEYLLADLAPIGYVQPGDHSHMRRSMSISNWAMSLLVAATADVKHHSGITEVLPVLVEVRRFVLDATAKAIREVASFNEVVEIRYGRLYALADLCYRLLTARPNHTHPTSSATSVRPSEDIALHIAKTMLEKNFVSVLTTALSEVDLDLPMVKPLLDRILKPLEHLTKAAIKMGKSSRKTAPDESRRETRALDAQGADASHDAHSQAGVDAMEVDSESDDDGEELTEGESEHEGTPDLYRNSALGIHQSENFTEHRGDSEEDDDSEDEDMEQMEYESDADASDRSDSSSDEEGDETIEEVMEIDAYDSDEDGESGEEDSEGEDEDAEMEDLSDEEGHEWVTDDEEEGQDDPAVYDEHPLDFVLQNNDGEQDLDERPEDFFALEGAFIDAAHDPRHLADDAVGDGIDDMGDDEDVDEEADEVSVDSYEQDDLAQLEFTGGPSLAGPPQDRFGANWGWTQMPALPRPTTGNRAQPMPIPAFLNPLQGDPSAPTGAHRRHTRLLDLDAPMPAHLHRTTGGHPATESITSHPLLVDQERASPASRPSASRERVLGTHHRGHTDWAQSLEELMAGGGGTMDLISSLLTRSGVMPTDGLRVTLSQNADGQPVVSMEGGGPGDGPHTLTGHGHLRAPHRHADAAHSQRRSPQRTDLVALVQEFLPVPTSQRWSEAARLVYTSVSESAERLVAHIVNVLQLRYRKSQQELQRKKETQRQLESKLSEFRREKARLAAELEEAKAEEAAARTAAGQPSRSVTESGADSEAPAGSSSNADSTEDDDEQARMAQAIALSQTGQTGGEDVEMEATSAAAEAQQPRRSGQSTPSADSRQANMELESLQRSLGELERRDGAEQPGGTASARTNATQQTTSIASGSEQSAGPRLTTTIRGRTVDITDSGIDPTFLEALPDDMREEVVNQHFRERRAGASMPALTDSSIAPEFLEALPPEIRAEVMRAEAAEAQRTAQAERSEASTRNEASASRPARDAARSDEVDPSSFIATLDPGLRDAALAQRDNTVFDRLPAGVAAELDHLRRVRQNQTADGQTVSNTIVQRREVPASTVAGQHQNSSRDAIQVLDKSGVATLVRLLFFPQMSSRSTVLHKVLANVQENARTREELLNLLLMILADGITDTHAVDKSYASMSARAVRTSQLSTGTPARPAPKRHHTAPGGHPTTPSQPTSAAPQPLSAPISRTGEEAPFLIASRSIDTLLHLTHSSEQTAWYFLREDVRGPKKIAKGKEKADTSQTAKEPRAPINILLGLLNKQAILGNPQLVDSLVALLSSVTKPLTNLPQAEVKETTKKDDGPAEDSNASGAPTEALSTGPAEAQPAPTRIEASSANLGTPAQSSSQPSGDSPPVTVMPVIPAERIAVVVKPLGTAISSRGFQHTLSIASNLTVVPGGRDVIIGSLRQEAEAAGKAMVKDLDNLLSSLPVPPKSSDDDDQVDSEQARVQSPVLSGLADGANSQAVLLRSLRAIEWLTHHEATASA